VRLIRGANWLASASALVHDADDARSDDPTTRDRVRKAKVARERKN